MILHEKSLSVGDLCMNIADKEYQEPVKNILYAKCLFLRVIYCSSYSVGVLRAFRLD